MNVRIWMWGGVLLGMGLTAGPCWAQPRETSEIYRVSKAGTGDALARERLLAIFGEVTKEFNAKAARDFAERKARYAGQQVRVIKPLGESTGHGPLFLVAYNGEPSVFAIPDGDYQKDDRTPPLEVEHVGNRETEVTRLVDDNGEEGEVKTGEQSEDLVSFFGITLDLGDGPVRARKKKEVTSTESLELYNATVSTTALTAPLKMSKDLFLNSLKNGETYEVTRMEERRCQPCNGFGRVPNDGSAPRESDGKMSCPECGGKGRVEWKVHYLVTW